MGLSFKAFTAVHKDMDYKSYYNHMREHSKKLLDYLSKNRDQYIGIEYISAAGTSESLMSRFGHSMLRFVDRDMNYGNDIVLSFEADIPEQDEVVAKYKKGLKGEYGVLPRLDLLQNFWEGYVRYESRPLERFIIPTTKEMREKIIDELVRINNDLSTLDNYTFLNRNCAGLLAQLFLDTGISTKSQSLQGRVPILFDGWLRGSLLAPYKSIRSLSPFIVYKKAKDILGLADDKKLNDYATWPENSIELLTNQMSKKEILFLYNEMWDLPHTIGSALAKKARYGSDLDYYDTIGMKILPESIYDLCLDQDCAQNNLKIEVALFGEEEAKKQDRKRFLQYRKAIYKKKKQHGSVIYTYVERRNAFSENNFLQNIRTNFEQLLYINN